MVKQSVQLHTHLPYVHTTAEQIAFLLLFALIVLLYCSISLGMTQKKYGRYGTNILAKCLFYYIFLLHASGPTLFKFVVRYFIREPILNHEIQPAQ